MQVGKSLPISWCSPIGSPQRQLERREMEIVASMALLLWRKRNFAMFRFAEHDQQRCETTQTERDTSWLSTLRATRLSVSKAGELQPIDRLLQDLQVEERIDGMIDKC